jgi:PBSX family phage terminase large subunit
MAISPKQKQIMAFPFTKYDALICDGAIRSGKTVFMMLSFVDDAMRRYDGQRFGICGKTVDATVKNIITPYLGLAYAQKKYNIQWRRTDKLLVVSDGEHENLFEVFGGKDESSFMLIQGRTLAGVLLDEVALQPRSFVEQAMARCSVDGSKLWFNCNPDSPEHWFYKEWICKPETRNALHLHFLLEDNPSLSAKIIERYKMLYDGVFYRRYILGEWCMAEGLIYNFFDKAVHVTDEMPEKGRYYISCDYGTLNPFSAGLWCVNEGRAIRIREYYYSGRSEQVQKTDEEYYTELEKLAGDLPIEAVVVDPSAASFIATIRRHGRFPVRKAKNDVLPGIRLTAAMLKAGIIKIGAACVDSIREFGLYRWEEKGEVDKPIKENDHAMDDIRYFCNTIMRRDFDARELLGGDTINEKI